MRARPVAFAAVVWLAGAAVASAQPTDASAAAPARDMAAGAPLGAGEWVVGIGQAASVGLFQAAAGRRYLVQTVSWGRELTRDYGPGVLRGRFAWVVEGMPVLWQERPGHLYGVGLAPVLWRWNFTPRSRTAAFAEIAAGGLWTSSPIPERTSRVNFTAHWGAGVRIGRPDRGRLVLAYRFQHFSNGNQLSTNPGVNSHLVLVGWSRRTAP